MSPASARRIRSPICRKFRPKPYAQLREITTNLEKHYKDMQDFEFTIQEGKLYMLQTRNGKRTGPAAVRIAVAMVEEGMISKKEAVLRVAPAQLDQLLHPVFDPKTLKDLVKVTTGISASPGAAVGRVAFTAEDAVEMAANGPVLLVRKETTPDDIHGMDVAKGILTAIGGKSSHAAVVARGMGRPCVVGASGIRIDEHKKIFTAQVDGKTVTVKEGDFISLDGTTGDVYLGQAKSIEPDLTPRLHRQVHGLDRRVPRQIRRARQRRYPARRQSRPPVRRRRHRPLPHRAHVLRRRPSAFHAGDDSRLATKNRGAKHSTSSCPCSVPISPASSKRWTDSPSSSARSIRRCTNSCPSAKT